uniref:Serine/arginine repetitive matrix protein 2 n=1 Tax=Parasteatoda tepidariorum TaxID=114398 RepID=A0A2L2XYP3_PARTP
MYNGIGLQTPRGSGTNGYVQRNMSFVPKSREKVNYKTEEDIKKLDALSNKKPNQGILAHERKRTIELKCLEMQELMEEQGYPDEEIEAKVAFFRKMLLEKDGGGEKEIPKDEFGRPLVKESHQIAEASQEKNAKMREALGISPFFVEGSSLDPERKSKEAAAAAAEEAKKKYTLIPDSSSDSSPEKSQEKEKNKKRKKKKSHSSRERGDTVSKKKKSAKRHRKERSESVEVHKKKKLKKPSKEKNKHKSNHKKQHTRSSSSSSASESDSQEEESSSRSSSRNSNSEVESDMLRKKSKPSAKIDQSHKEHRKRSSSSESIRYSKDSRSRKDIYEAKKAKRKRKPSHSSSSSSSRSSSPKQYFRLEPVLLKSKHKKGHHQIIEIPTNNAFELKKYDKKKRSRHSSSSVEELSKHEGKKRKRSDSPTSAKSSKHYSGRETDKGSKQSTSYKSSRSDKEGHHRHSPEKHRHHKSRSNDSPHLSQNRKARSVSPDSEDALPKKRKDNYQEESVEYTKKSSSSKKKQSKYDSPSPKRNGTSKPATKSYSPESDVSKKSARSGSSKYRKQIHATPPQSPPVYKHKKHILQSPDYVPNNEPVKKRSQKSASPSPSPPRKEKYKKSQKSGRNSSPEQSIRKHNRKQKSQSPVSDSKYSKDKESKRFQQQSNGESGYSGKKKLETDTRTKSPSYPRTIKSKSKREIVDSNRSQSPDSDDAKRHVKKKKRFREEADVCSRSSSRSPSHERRKYSDSKLDKTHSSNESRQPQSKNYASNSNDTTQVSSSKTNLQHSRRDSNYEIPTRIVKDADSKIQKRSRSPQVETQTIEITTHKVIVSDQESPKADRPNSSRKMSSSPSNKPKEQSSTVATELPEENISRNKGKWVTVSNGVQPSKTSPNKDFDEGPIAKKYSTSPTKEVNNSRDSERPTVFENENASKKSENASKSSPHIKSSSSHSKKDSSRKIRNSRSRSISHSRSRSHSVRSSRSRSRSYSKSRSKSYSKSRSKSYSKSRSHSRSRSHRDSRSRSHSRSCSASYSRSGSVSICSRSRSRSYSSRSRSRSIARSPSIPRRRGSPSFLDKRRITSGNKCMT